MIDKQIAIELTVKAFPRGPEALAKHLGVRVYDDIDLDSNCDGYFLRRKNNAIIRLNKSAVTVRKRFTLAHELAHLILGTTTLLRKKEPFKSTKAEERDADALAAELLVPLEFLKKELTALPIEMATISRLANIAVTSVPMMACHIANHADLLSIKNGYVMSFELNSNKLNWEFSRTLKRTDDENMEVLLESLKAGDGVYRETADTDVVVYSLCETPYSKIVFVQRLPQEIGNQTSVPERLRQLSVLLFKDDPTFQNSLASKIGFFFKKHSKPGQTPKQVTDAFIAYYEPSEKNSRRLQKMKSVEGKEFIQLHMTRQRK